MYRIKIDYKTGNSFGSQDETDFIEYEWTNLDKAKESLKRIKNHNEFDKENSNCYTKPKVEIPEGVIWDNEYRMIMLELVDDDGNVFKYSPFWIGYFERLYCAEIVFDDNDLKYEDY